MKTIHKFTLLELITVILLLSLVVSGVVPIVDKFTEKAKKDQTLQIFENIKTAIMGEMHSHDLNKQITIGGFVGDELTWPELWESQNIQYIPASHSWHYAPPAPSDPIYTKVDNPEVLNEGQPRGLWTAKVNGKDNGTFREIWKGPYITIPKNLNETDMSRFAKNQAEYDNLSIKDKKEFRAKFAENKIADAWGRAIYFLIKDDVFYMISSGPDQWLLESAINTDPLDKTSFNADNIVYAIHKDEWFSYLKKQTDRQDLKHTEVTKETLKKIRIAIIGNEHTNKHGEWVIGGYLGDFGEWPTPYHYDSTDWVKKDPTGISQNGPLLGLFKNDESLEYDVSSASLIDLEPKYIGWRGPYFKDGLKEEFRDGWGNPIVFSYENSGGIVTNINDATFLKITSSGKDQDLLTDDDNLVEIIYTNKWKYQNISSVITLSGRFYNWNKLVNSWQPSDADKFRFYCDINKPKQYTTHSWFVDNDTGTFICEVRVSDGFQFLCGNRALYLFDTVESKFKFNTLLLITPHSNVIGDLSLRYPH